MPDTNLILSLNCGSSSLKFGVYSGDTALLFGEAEEIGHAASAFSWRDQKGAKSKSKQPLPDHVASFHLARQAFSAEGLSQPIAVGHRVVHGGPKLRNHFRLTPETLQNLKEAVPFAPLHLPSSLAVIEAVSQWLPNVPQVICLDTAFHRNLPDVSKTIPFSAGARALGIERYGFHGLAVESILAQLNPIPKRLVVAQLGNGSSITAILSGNSIDNSMGLTPSGGVMMGTRCGDVDPGALLYLQRQGKSADQLATLVDRESGLLGVSERTSDVRELIQARATDPKCDLALRMFAYQVKKTIAGMAAALRGLDMLVFTGGIGEHAHPVRDEILSGLKCLNAFEIRVLPADEDLQIARITSSLLKTSAA